MSEKTLSEILSHLKRISETQEAQAGAIQSNADKLEYTTDVLIKHIRDEDSIADVVSTVDQKVTHLQEGLSLYFNLKTTGKTLAEVGVWLAKMGAIGSGIFAVILIIAKGGVWVWEHVLTKKIPTPW